VSRVGRFCSRQLQRLRLSLFEKVILANSLMLIGEALVGLWVTSHSLEAHHYLIDTSFIVAATLLTLTINVVLLRISFRPLFSLLATIRAISAGKTQARAKITATDSEIAELAQAFNSMLDQLEATRREQALLILQAQEEERRRLSLELHDESSQTLTALLIHAEILNQSLAALPDSAITEEVRASLRTGLNNLSHLTQDTLENIRTLAQQLRPGVLDDLGLHAAFRWLAEDSLQRLHLPVELRLDDVQHILEESDSSGLYGTTLFRITQECLTNIARHAHARHACITLEREQQHICLQVRDDGCGFDPSTSHAGLGIPGMRERATLLGGTITIRSAPGQGTTVEVILPLPVTQAKGGTGER
jgi:two-component system sensor histidine kinase UhpB